MYPKNAKGLSASLASRLSKGNQGFSNRDTKGGFSNQQRPSNKKSSVQSRLGLPLRNRASVHNRLNSGPSGVQKSRRKEPQKIYQPSIKLLKNEILSNISLSSSSRRRRLQSRYYNSEEDSMPVRINKGTVVKGLRSDQLLLQKHRSPTRPRPTFRMARPVQKPMNEDSSPYVFKRPGRVSVDFNSGFKVSIENDVMRNNKNHRLRQQSTDSEDYSMSTDEAEVETVVLSKDERQKKELHASLMRIGGSDRPKPPVPHRQVLDPLVKKEIAVLQGGSSASSSDNNRPGPGIKNFKMIPNLTKNSLSQRFTIDKK